MGNLRKSLMAISALVVGMSSTASAQINTDFQAEIFEPMPDQRTNTLNLARSQPLPHLKPGLNLFLHFVDDPVQVVQESGDDNQIRSRLIDDQLKTEVGLGIGFFDIFDISASIPLVVYQTGDPFTNAAGETAEVNSFSLQDIRVVPKIRFIDPAWTGGFGAALVVPVYIPVGDTDSFAGADSLRVEPRLALDWFSEGGFGIVLNAGYQIRDTRRAQQFVQDDAIRLGGGLEVPVASTVTLIGDVHGEIPLEDGFDPNNPQAVASNAQGSPFEALGGVRFLFGDVHVQAGGGAGFTDGVGAPDFRLFASLGWTPFGSDDADGDGILDDEDQCPDVPEDKDGFEDGDGCPDEDNDQDGILDDADSCPDEPEDVDTFEDENGCPDPDNDQDGVLDVDDQCPLEAGEAVNNGCPIKDSDGDGIMDPDDKCAADPEDKDGFEDTDGCPDLDNDQDGILDQNDQCPNEAEIINGNKDEDGCPDKGKSKIKVTDTQIELQESVYFDSGKATIKKVSYSLLNQVASVLKAQTKITKILIEGHTDSRGSEKSNLKLSDARAAAVRTYLIGQGIAPDRIKSEGFGEARPIASNKSKSGRAKNRRVEIHILEVDGKTVGKGAVIKEKTIEQ